MSPNSSSLLFSILLLLLLTMPTRLHSLSNSLHVGDSLTPTQNLTSSTGAFVLGFFSPSNSTSSSYLGVWRAGSSPLDSVWVANRISPVPLRRAILRLSNSSNLEISDSGSGTVLWSSNTTLPFTSNTTTIALLLDTGELVLNLAEGGATIWRAFDHAADTVLPTMPIWANYRAHVAATAYSWRSPIDPAPGEFSLSIDPDTALQGIIKRGAYKWWRGNVWNGVAYTRVIPGGNSGVVPFLSFTVVPYAWWNLSFISSQFDGIMSVRLEYNGSAVMRVWNKVTSMWNPVFSFNDKPCELYGQCGPNGYCSTVSPGPCRCLDGFEPQDPIKWESGAYAGGCVRTKGLVCNGKDDFVKFEKMKLPDYNLYLKEVVNESACAEVCIGNCSCVAYAYADLWTGLTTPLPRCLVWVGGLMDLVQRTDDTGEDLYVRVRIVDSGSSKKDVKLFVIVPIVAGASIIAVVFCLIWIRKKRKGPIKNEEKGNWGLKGKENSEDISALNTFSDEINGGGPDLPLLDYEIIISVTDNFSDVNKVGQGGFGHVYKGTLPGGSEVAIKRLSKESGQGLVEFKNELVLIANLQHRNLVKLLNYCIHGEERLLVYEYMPNKSLDLFLFDNEKQWLLDWSKRFNIIKGIARGLLYLHEDSRLKIIHRDLKASNILLDEDMNGKISDFGMARIFGGTQNQANTIRIVGTYGYMAPEYAMEGLFSVKSDVYSFGVLLLEIITGQKNTSFRTTRTFPSLLSYAWESWNSGNAMEIVASSLRDSCSLHEVERCLHIGLLCVQDDPLNRPNMSSVVFMLENETPIKAKPENPTFTGWTSHDDSTQRILGSEGASVNHISITVMEGR